MSSADVGHQRQPDGAGTQRKRKPEFGATVKHATAATILGRRRAADPDRSENVYASPSELPDPGPSATPSRRRTGDLTFYPPQAIDVYGSVTAIAPNGADVYVGCGCAISGQDFLSRWTWSAPTGTNALSGSTGDTVTISGTGFVGVPASGGVMFGSTPVSFTRSGTSQINATVPVGLASGTYTINVNAVGGTVSVGTVEVTQRIDSGGTPSIPATGADTPLPTLFGAILVVSGILIVVRRRLVRH